MRRCWRACDGAEWGGFEVSLQRMRCRGTGRGTATVLRLIFLNRDKNLRAPFESHQPPQEFPAISTSCVTRPRSGDVPGMNSRRAPFSDGAFRVPSDCRPTTSSTSAGTFAPSAFGIQLSAFRVPQANAACQRLSRSHRCLFAVCSLNHPVVVGVRSAGQVGLANKTLSTCVRQRTDALPAKAQPARQGVCLR